MEEGEGGGEGGGGEGGGGEGARKVRIGGRERSKA